MRLLLFAAFALVGTSGCGESAAPANLDAGDDAAVDMACTPRASFAATGFYRTERDCGRWWLVDPDGKRFYSTGVNHVQYQGDYSPTTKTNPYAEAVAKKYGSEDKWAAATVARLAAWGWNTVGSWSGDVLGPLMPYTQILSLSGADWQSGAIPDYFADVWAKSVADKVAASVPAHATERNLVGWFVDNEMHWGPDWRSGDDLMLEYLKLDGAAPGKQALVKLMSERHGADIASFNRAWSTTLASFAELGALAKLPATNPTPEAAADRSAFIRAAADRFFSVTSGAIRARDANHLVLGVRFVASLTPREVAEASAAFLDVVSVNSYEYTIDPQTIFAPDRLNLLDLGAGAFLEVFARATDRPILVSEFGFRAKDSGLPNSWPPFYPTLATQAERADRFAAYAARCHAAPWIVGYHWFEFADQPAAGRFDGENNNWGLVTSGDDPWEVLVARSAKENVAPTP